MEFNVYTWGEADSLATILGVLKDIAQNGEIQLFMNIMFIVIAAVTFTRSFITGRDIFNTFVLFFIGTYSLFFFFTKVYYTVNIVDVRNPSSPPARIDEVPAPVAITAHYFSAFEKVLMDVISTSFQTPSGINYNNAGYNYGANLFSVLPKAHLSDPYLRRTLVQFIYDCFYEDVLQGNKDFNTLYTTNDIWGYLSPVANTYTYIYYSTSPSGTPVTCSESYSYLNTQLESVAPNQLNNLLSALTFIPGGGTNLVSSAFQDFLGQTTNNSATEVFKNTVSAKYIYDALQYASVDSLVSNDIRPYAEQIAKNNVFKNWEIGGSNARELLPAVKSLIQLALFALFPFLLMMIFTPMRAMYIKMYITLFFWLSLWDPLFAILTYVSHLRLENLLTGVSYGQGYTMATMGPIFEQAMAHMAIWNYFALAIPMLALALAKGSEHALVGLANSITSGIAAGGAAVGGKISTPQGAGDMLGGAKEVARYGGQMAFNEAADRRLLNAMKYYGTNAADRGLEMLDPGAVTNAAKQEEIQKTAAYKDFTDKESIDIGTAQQVRSLLNSGRVLEGIKQSGGSIEEYVNKLATAGAIKDVGEAKALLHAVENVFGNGDGNLTSDEIENYQDFMKHDALYKNKERSEYLKKAASTMMEKNPNMSFKEALLKAATLIGQGETARKFLHSVKNQADLSALMELSGFDFDKAKQLWENVSALDLSKEFSKVEELAKRGRELLGDKAKGKSDFEVISMMGSMFGENSTQKEIYNNLQWQAFAEELKGAKNKENFIEKIKEAAKVKGGLDAAAVKGLEDVADNLGYEDLKDLVQSKTAGNLLRDIVEGTKNKDVIKALGNGNYKNGLKAYKDILTKQDYSNAKKAESMYNELVNRYKSQGMSDLEALAKASADLGKFEAFGKEGQITALQHFGERLRDAFASEQIGKAAVSLGTYEQSGGDLDNLEKFMKEKGMMDTAQAQAMFTFSSYLEKLGLSEQEANSVYQAVKEGGGFLHSLSSFPKFAEYIGVAAAIKTLVDKFKGKMKDPSLIKNAEKTLKTMNQNIKGRLFADSSKDAIKKTIESERGRLLKKLQSLESGTPKYNEVMDEFNKLRKLENEVNKINFNNPNEVREKLFNPEKNLFKEIFKGDSEEAAKRMNEVRSNFVENFKKESSSIRKGLVDGRNMLVKELKDKISTNQNLSAADRKALNQRLDSLVKNISKNPGDTKAIAALDNFIQNDLVKKGIISSKDVKSTVKNVAKSLEKEGNTFAARFFKEAADLGGKAAAKTAARVGIGLAARGAAAFFTGPVGWVWFGADLVSLAVTGETLEEHVIDKFGDMMSGDDDQNPQKPEKIEKSPQDIAALKAGSKEAYDKIRASDLGYTQDNFAPVYNQAIESYIKANENQFKNDKGEIDYERAVSSFNQNILGNPNSKEYQGYYSHFYVSIHKIKNGSGTH